MQPDPPSVQTWLETLLTAEGAVAGSVHYERGEDLELAAHHNIPPPVLERIRSVPRGRGMAGLAQVRREPVQTCNLKTDDTGNVRPMAKLVGGQAAVAIPVIGADGALRAIVGLAFAFEGDLPPARMSALSRAAAGVPARDAAER